jgi:hypothetical protein
MDTIIAALIAAVVALLVTIVERILLRRDERRKWEISERRTVYARFLAASYQVRLGLPGDEALGIHIGQAWQDFSAASGELDLLGSPAVQRAGKTLHRAIVTQGADRLTTEQAAVDTRTAEFVAAARKDLAV